MIQPITGTEPIEAGATSRGAANEQITQDQFLLLFVAQLQHQDPLSPLEPDQLTAQLAQFSSLEQLTGINERLDALNASADRDVGTTLLGLLGREVEVDSSRIGVVDGEAAEVRFRLTQPGNDVRAVVRNADGAIVGSAALGNLAAGDHEFRFDGKGNAGVQVPDGTYTVEIRTRRGDSAETEAVPTTVAGVVDGVDLAASPPTILVNGTQITFDQVRAVRPADDDE